MSLPLRAESIRAITKDAHIKIMLVSLKSGSLGLNLVRANNIVLLDPWWNPSIDSQAIDRVHRIGQTRPVSIWRLTIEHSVGTAMVIVETVLIYCRSKSAFWSYKPAREKSVMPPLEMERQEVFQTSSQQRICSSFCMDKMAGISMLWK